VFEAFDSLKAENIALNVANEKLRQDNLHLQVTGGDVGDLKGNERIQVSSLTSKFPPVNVNKALRSWTLAFAIPTESGVFG
jgi:hypothetical protein